MSAAKIIRLGANPPAPETSRPGQVVAADPLTTTHNYFTDSTGQFFCGIWESTPGKWECSYTESEFVYLISGRVRLTDADGEVQTFDPGQAFVIPAGFKGAWETVETVRKYYAIFQAS